MAITNPLPGLYSYCGDGMEDIILARLLADIDTGFYVDVGACLPTYGSVTKYFYDRLWSGINIEPLPNFFIQLCHERPRDINLNIGISNKSGNAVLHSAAGLSTLNEKTAERLKQERQVRFEDIPIELYTLEQIFNSYVRDRTVHFLKIDVESHEKAVLESLDFSTYTPWIVCVESTFPYTMEPLYHEWEPILTQSGYQLLLQHDVNRYYAHITQYHERIEVFQSNNFVGLKA